MLFERPSAAVMLARGMVKRCPVCGERGLFTSWFQIRERCPRCELRFEQGEGAFLGSMTINYSVAGLVFFAFLAVYLILTLPAVNALVLTLASLGVIALSLLVFFPFSKTLWAAFSVLIHDPADVDVRSDGGRGSSPL